jgi:hypothetical protein
MKLTMPLFDAFDHMIQNWKGATPKDLHEAREARLNRRPYPLGEKRARSMLQKHGGGKYVISEIVTYDDEPNPTKL